MYSTSAKPMLSIVGRPMAKDAMHSGILYVLEEIYLLEQ